MAQDEPLPHRSKQRGGYISRLTDIRALTFPGHIRFKRKSPARDCKLISATLLSYMSALQVYLLWYDLLTFVVCAGALVYVLQLREWLLDDWMVKHAARTSSEICSAVPHTTLAERMRSHITAKAFFAIQMVHGYLSMPFFFFTIPLIRPLHKIRWCKFGKSARCLVFGTSYSRRNVLSHTAGGLVLEV